MKPVYLDNNATTALDPRVIEAMIAELNGGPANPSSIHRFGREARQRLLKARQTVADYLHVLPEELIFTSSGTEALNLAILGISSKGTILTSPIEHSAIHSLLPTTGKPLHYLPIGKEGHVFAEDVKTALDSKNIGMIVLSAVNAETGVKNPIEQIANLALAYDVPFVVDGVASLGKEEVLLPPGVTAMGFSSHKLHGPKGVGLLFVRQECQLTPLLIGGGQESLRRAGTENLAGIIGFAKAIELLKDELPKAQERMLRLRSLLESRLEGVKINGTGPRICNTSSISFEGIDGESLLIQLDLHGIAASMGSACSAGALEPSRVLLQMGLSKTVARSTLRFSLSRYNDSTDIEYVINTLSSLRSSLAQ